MTRLTREELQKEWLKAYCPTCANNDDRGTNYCNCQAEYEVEKDIGIACIHYEEYHEDGEERMTREESIERLKNIAWLCGSSDRDQNIKALDMAISALKTPTAADAICAIRKQINFTRDRIKDGHDGEFEHGIIRGCQYSIRLIREIKALPSSEAAQGWIPVSERLPDIGDTFLVTVMVGTKVETDVADSFGSYIDGFWNTFNDWIEDEECHVIAWMPLPDPYREDGEA